jgi:hypothetical protein
MLKLSNNYSISNPPLHLTIHQGVTLMKSFMFVFAVMLVLGLSSFANAQTALTNADFSVTVDVTTSPLVIAAAGDLTVSDGNAGYITPGTSFTLVPTGDNAGTGTFIDAAGGAVPGSGAGVNAQYSAIVANSVPAIIQVTGASSANISVSFALPSVLYPVDPTAGAGIVKVAYNGTSACWADDAGNLTYFNPTQTESVLLNADPTAGTFIYLGGIFTVDKNAQANLYGGTGIVTVAYLAN